MKLFHRKTRMERMRERAVPAAKRAGATALGVTGTAVAATAASAAISTVRKNSPK